MTDLEMTRLCAEAMGWTCRDVQGEYGIGNDRFYRVYDGDEPIYGIGSGWITSKWRPLHDDAQAMALVKKFPWQAFMALTDLGYGKSWSPLGNEFNRSVVECAAKMQQAKEAK